jgi:hypothetical protein
MRIEIRSSIGFARPLLASWLKDASVNIGSRGKKKAQDDPGFFERA